MDILYSQNEDVNKETFIRFFTLYYPKAKALACRFVSESVAEDIVQDMFLMLWQNRSTLNQTVESLPSYLYRSTQNSCLNHLKHKGIKEEYDQQLRLTEERMRYLDESVRNDVWNEAVENNLHELMEEIISSMPERTAQAFRLRYYEDKSHKEIAKAMGITVRTVETHIRQATLTLRDKMKDCFYLLTPFVNLI